MFACANGVTMWNSLPAELRQRDLPLGQFRIRSADEIFCFFMISCINVLTRLLTYTVLKTAVESQSTTCYHWPPPP